MKSNKITKKKKKERRKEGMKGGATRGNYGGLEDPPQHPRVLTALITKAARVFRKLHESRPHGTIKGSATKQTLLERTDLPP